MYKISYNCSIRNMGNKVITIKALLRVNYAERQIYINESKSNQVQIFLA